MRFSCPGCRKQLRVQDAAAGRLVSCPGCKNKIRVPTAPEPEEFVITEEAPDEAVVRAEHLPRPQPRPKVEAAQATPVLSRPPMRNRDEEGEDDDGPRRSRPRRKRWPGRASLDPRIKVFLALIGLWVAALLVDMFVTRGLITMIFALTQLAAGSIFLVVGRLMMLLAAVNAGFIQCILCLTVPFYGLLHYEFRRGFWFELCGWGLLVLGFITLGAGVLLFRPEPPGMVIAERQPNLLIVTGEPKLDEILKDLKSRDPNKVTHAFVELKWFLKMPHAPVQAKHQAQIAKWLADLAKVPDSNIRMEAIHALETWATAEELPVLTEAVNDPSIGVSLAAKTSLRVARERVGRKDENLAAAPKEEEKSKPRKKAEPVEPPVLTGDPRLDQLLSDMASTDPGPARRAVDQFANAPVQPKHQALIAKKLAELVKAPDPSLRRSAIRALKIWGTPDEVPALIDALDDPDVFARGDAFSALTKFKDERAIKPAVRALKEDRNRGEAAKLLRDIGPAAETEVLPLVETKDTLLFWNVMDILRDIGTERSLPTLQAIAIGPDFGRRLRAEQTFKAIVARLKK